MKLKSGGVAPFLCAAVVVFRSVAASSAALAAVTDDGVSLVGEGLKISFAGPSDGFGIKFLENCISDPVRFGGNAAGKSDFWQLVFVMDGGADLSKAVKLNNRAPCRERKVVQTAGGSALSFHWLGLTVPGGEPGAVDVCAEVKLVDGNESEWRLSVTNRDSGRALFETHYPCIPQVVADGAADVFTPGRNLGGRLVRNYDSRKEWRKWWGYPSLYPMVAAFMRSGAGLYVAAHDPEARIKSLSLSAGCNLSFGTVVENAGVCGKAAEGPRYPVVVSAFGGDWWQIPRRYRKWALKQKWCSKGRMAERRDWPNAMSDVDLWFLSNQCSAENLRKRMEKIRGYYPGLKLGVHWYGWNAEKPNLGDCPYFTPGPDVRETVEFMKDRDVLLMPYVDGRLYAKSSPRFKNARRDACSSASGELYEEKWGSGHYVVMCPSSVRFGDAVFENATNVVFGSGFGAIYEDQVACSRALPCFDASHGHPLGGGSWWADGYRRILAPLHSVLSAANRPVTSEGAGEMWLDLIDGYLQAESPLGDDVPFFPAVYGGYAVYFGARMKYKDPRAFFALQARALAWGVAPNWQRVSFDFVEGRLDGSIEILRRVARVRKAAKEFLKYGSLEDALRIVDNVPFFHIEWQGADGEQCGKTFSADLPEVFGTVWRDSSGSRSAACVVNAADVRRTIRFAPVFEKDPVLLKVEGEEPSKLGKDGSLLSLEIPPQGLALLVER